MSKMSFLNAHGLNLSQKTTLDNSHQFNNTSNSKSSTRQNPNPNTNTNTSTNATISYNPNIHEMKRVFDTYDTNKDGKVSREEYKAVLRAVSRKGDMINTDAEATREFNVADKDGDGYIDFQEFMELHNNKVKSKDIENAFEVFDSNGDGKISANELMEVLRRMGEKCGLESCKKMIKEVDNDGDGLINLDEFNSMMTRSMKLAN